jgi:predicted nucleotidyltransferase
MSDHLSNTLGIDDIIGDQREIILRLASARGASHVRIFGSVARGEARPDSDVDVLVKFDGSMFELVGLWQDLQEVLGRTVSLVAEDDPSDRFMGRILREAVPL